MNDDDKRYKGKLKEKLEDAFESAWEEAKAEGAGPGTYEAKILIEADNPIRGYIVVIGPPDD